MYQEEIHFRNCYLDRFGTFDPVTPVSIWYPRWMCGPSLRKVDSRVIDRKRFLHILQLTFDPKQTICPLFFESKFDLYKIALNCM